MQGCKPLVGHTAADVGLGQLKNVFPNDVFPIGAVHEFISKSNEDASASSGFMAGIIAALMKGGGACLWISAANTTFPPALKWFGIEPDKVIFVRLQKSKDMLWAMEEALKCNGLATVVGEIPELDLTTSRRLQLAVEKSGVTGFILRRNPKQLITTACVTRWHITSLPSALPEGMPGVGFPRWTASLLKVRNGKPGSWKIEWKAGSFHLLPEEVPAALPTILPAKTGSYG